MDDSMDSYAMQIRSFFTGAFPTIAIVLGSGFDGLCELIEDAQTMAYKDVGIRNFPVSKVPGHRGRFVVGAIGGKRVIAMDGRPAHFYEAGNIQTVVFPIRMLVAAGIETVLLTNAVGGIKRSYNPGDLVIVRDSINHYPSANPMFGLGHELFGPYFLDMTNLYDVGLREIAAKKANETRIDLRLGGVLNFFPGPQIETPAEILAMERNGCDMTGMSLVPEAMAAYHMGRRNGTQKPVKVFGLSCIANRAAGTGDGKSAFSHTDEVLPTVRRAAERAKPFFEAFIAAVP